jgi:hypothetical protein
VHNSLRTEHETRTMQDQPFFRKPHESVEAWHARLAAIDPVQLSCHLRQRRRIWLEMAYQALQKERRSRKAPRRRP